MLLYRKTITPKSTLTVLEQDDPTTISYDIDSANKRAKQLLSQNNSRSYLNERARLMRRKNLVEQKHLTMDEMETKSQRSISSLRKERQREQEREQMILNRLKFVEMERQRNLKTAAWARRKYSVMVERRTQNLQMKETLNQRENVEYVRKLKEKSVMQKQERQRNIKNWRNQHQEEAAYTKHLKQQTHEKLSQLKQEENLRNKHRVMDVKQKQFDLLSKKSAISQSRKQMAERNWQQKLVGQLHLKKDTLVHHQLMQKRNQELFKKLVLRTDTVKRASERAKSQLQRLEEVMSSSRSRITPSASRNSKSFFLTKE